MDSTGHAIRAPGSEGTHHSKAWVGPGEKKIEETSNEICRLPEIPKSSYDYIPQRRQAGHRLATLSAGVWDRRVIGERGAVLQYWGLLPDQPAGVYDAVQCESL